MERLYPTARVSLRRPKQQSSKSAQLPVAHLTSSPGVVVQT